LRQAELQAEGSQPFMPIVTGTWERIQPGMDTSMDTIVVGVLRPGGEVSAVHVILNDGESLRRLIGKFPGCPSLAVLLQATIFSPVQAASPDGESCRAAPRVEGLVACWWS